MMKKSKDAKKKLQMMKSSDLRVYKDNCRPAVFEDKRRKEKHNNKEIEY